MSRIGNSTEIKRLVAAKVISFEGDKNVLKL